MTRRVAAIVLTGVLAPFASIMLTAGPASADPIWCLVLGNDKSKKMQAICIGQVIPR